MGVFAYHGPLGPDDPLFRGRTAQLASLIQLCQGEVRAYAIIYGGRQTGKTSLLLRLADRLPEPIRTCRVDFQGVPRARTAQVYAHLARCVTRCLPHPVAAPEVNDAPSLTEFLCQAVSQPEVGRLVLFLEELGALPQDSREDLAHLLRYIFTNRFDIPCRPLARLMVVLAGGIELYELAATQVSPLQNICEPIYLPDLSEAEAIGLVADGLTSLGMLRTEAEELGRVIYAHLGGHPYLTQRLGGLLEEGLAAGESPTPAHVDSAVERLLSGDLLLFHLRRALDEQHLLAAGKALLDGHLRFSRLVEDMARLELLGLSSEANGYWKVRNQLLARALEDWLAAWPQPGLLRLQHLADNISQDLALLKDYEDALRYEDDPRRRAKYRRGIEQLRGSAVHYQREYAELQAKVTGEPSVAMQDIATQLQQMNARLDALQATIRNDLSELRRTMIARFDASEQTIITAVVERLDQSQLGTVQAVMDAVEARRISEAELQETMTELQHALTELRQKGAAFPDPTMISKIERMSELVEAPTLDVKHKLKVAIPLIPWILSYEGEIELQDVLNLKTAWQLLVDKVRGR